MNQRLNEERMELALYEAMELFLNDEVDNYCLIGNDTAMQMRNVAMSVLYAVKEVQDYMKSEEVEL